MRELRENKHLFFYILVFLLSESFEENKPRFTEINIFLRNCTIYGGYFYIAFDVHNSM
jgi:hypothetical protein